MDNSPTPQFDDRGTRDSVPPLTPPEGATKRDRIKIEFPDHLLNPRTREAARDAIVLKDLQRILDQADGYVRDMNHFRTLARDLYLRLFRNGDSLSKKILLWMRRTEEVEEFVKSYQSGRESDIKFMTEVLQGICELKKGQDNFALALAGLRSDIAEIKRAKNPAKGVSPNTIASKSKKTTTFWDRIKTRFNEYL